LAIALRDCIEGEELLSSGKCTECGSGTYLLTPSTGVTSCKEC